MTRTLGAMMTALLMAPVLMTPVVLTGCGGASDAASEPIVVDQPAGGDEGEADTTGELVVGDDACTTDADCVPADCCHAAACVARERAPSCGDAVCTTECRYGTIDCGGGCLCHEGRCAARLSAAPDLSVQ